MERANETVINIPADVRSARTFSAFHRRIERLSANYPRRWFPINDLLGRSRGGWSRGQKLIGAGLLGAHEFLADSPTVSN